MGTRCRDLHGEMCGGLSVRRGGLGGWGAGSGCHGVAAPGGQYQSLQQGHLTALWSGPKPGGGAGTTLWSVLDISSWGQGTKFSELRELDFIVDNSGGEGRGHSRSLEIPTGWFGVLSPPPPLIASAPTPDRL